MLSRDVKKAQTQLSELLERVAPLSVRPMKAATLGVLLCFVSGGGLFPRMQVANHEGCNSWSALMCCSHCSARMDGAALEMVACRRSALTVPMEVAALEMVACRRSAPRMRSHE